MAADLAITDTNVGEQSNGAVHSNPPNPDLPPAAPTNLFGGPDQTINEGQQTPTENVFGSESNNGPVNTQNNQPESSYQNELDAAEARLRELIVPPWEISPYLRVHLYGRPGSGKTVLGASSGLKTLFIDIEEGALSLNNHPELAQLVKVIPFESFKQMQVLVEVIKNGGFKEFEVIEFDTWSELAKDETDQAYQQNKNNPKAARLHPDLAAGMDYQVANEHMRRLAASLRGINKHIVFVSHLKEEKDKNGVITRIRPNLSPALTSTMEAFVSVLGYMSAEHKGTQGTVRTLQTTADALVDAKTRIGGLPPILQNASFADLLKANEAMRQNASKTPATN